jgi:hypothetical protein
VPKYSEDEGGSLSVCLASRTDPAEYVIQELDSINTSKIIWKYEKIDLNTKK